MSLNKPIAEQLTQAVPKNSSSILQFQVQDENGSDVAKANINTATMALTNKSDGATINSHTATDILADISSTGLCTRHLTATDNAIIGTDSGIEDEVHVAVISINVTSGANNLDLRWVYYITVLNPQ